MEYIFWVDLEMTGLDPEVHQIIEFAGIITDLSFTELATIHHVVFQPKDELDKMDEWNQRTHSDSGLLAEIPSGRPLAEVEGDALRLLTTYFPEGGAVLAGNSIHQDRKFIDRYMPELSKQLHYRMLDVSSFKQVFKFIYNLPFEKDNSHRALDDIRASIRELQFYQTFIRIPAGQQPTGPAS